MHHPFTFFQRIVIASSIEIAVENQSDCVDCHRTPTRRRKNHQVNETIHHQHQSYKPYDAIYKRLNRMTKIMGEIQGICRKMVVARKPTAAISITTIAR
jgi:hypothetical protein